MFKTQQSPEFKNLSDNTCGRNRRPFGKSCRQVMTACKGSFRTAALLFFLGLGIPATALASVVRFDTPLGSFDVEMFDEDAPLTVENFLNYVKDGDFANSFVHRRSRGFVIQGGGYTWVDGTLGDVPADPPVPNEFKLSNVRGTIAMAKLGGDPNSATSEWFINLGDNSDNLDSQNGGFTVFGRVLGDGMDVVDAIAALQIWNFGGAFDNLPLIDFQDDGPLKAENFVFTDITLVGADDTEIDIASVADISGDAVPDVAYLTSKNQPKVSYYSGANGNKLRTVKYLGAAWTGIAAATVGDSNANGVANDPSIAVLASKNNGSKHSVEVRRAKNGALINRIDFLGQKWQVIDVAVIDDGNGDGVTDDTVIAVLGLDPERPSQEQIRVQVRQLSDGRTVGDWFFLNGTWTPLALEGVNRAGQPPLLAVLANKAKTGDNVVQARKLNNGSLQPTITFLDSGSLARDLAVLKDSNGDGTASDPAYLVLGNEQETGRNKVQARRVNNGKWLKNINMIGTNWDARRVMSADDISGNLIEEVGVLAKKRTGSKVVIEVKDFADETTTERVSP